MAYRDDALRSRLKAYLERRACPKHLETNSRAKAAEVDALVRAIDRMAPRDGYEDWWPKFEDKLDESRKVAIWPTVGEIMSAARAVQGPSSARLTDGTELDELDVMAGRFESGEPVPDGFLFGRKAVEILRSGKVTPDRIKQYRSAWFFRAKDVYGEDKARQIEADMLARHQAAVTDADAQPRQYNVPKPQPKMMTRYEWDGAQ